MTEGRITETQYQVAQRKRMYISALLILLLVPLIIGAGSMLGTGSYMIVSVLILILIMAPFFMIFEKRKPKAREIVLIAMMCALVVTIHLVFHIAFPVQIGTALIIVSGIALGPEAGFLIGALARFICNFYMGQGAWTPWQMFCWGILGFLAGLAFNRGNIEKLNSRSFKLIMGPTLVVIFFEIVAYTSVILFPGNEEGGYQWRFYVFGAVGLLLGILLQRKRLPISGITMAAFTFVTAFIVYGGIMNMAFLVTASGMPGSEPISLVGLKTIYISGLPYDLMHALTAALSVFIIGEPMIQKLERIKIKYGIYK